MELGSSNLSKKAEGQIAGTCKGKFQGVVRKLTDTSKVKKGNDENCQFYKQMQNCLEFQNNF